LKFDQCEPRAEVGRLSLERDRAAALGGRFAIASGAALFGGDYATQPTIQDALLAARRAVLGAPLKRCKKTRAQRNRPRQPADLSQARIAEVAGQRILLARRDGDRGRAPAPADIGRRRGAVGPLGPGRPRGRGGRPRRPASGADRPRRRGCPCAGVRGARTGAHQGCARCARARWRGVLEAADQSPGGQPEFALRANCSMNYARPGGNGGER
jgi:hypothetical protein